MMEWKRVVQSDESSSLLNHVNGQVFVLLTCERVRNEVNLACCIHNVVISIYHITYRKIIADQVHPFTETYSLMAVAFLSRILCLLQCKYFSEMFSGT